MNRTFKNDYEFGLQREEEIFNLIIDHFKYHENIKFSAKFSLYDYESSDGATFELKSRRCKKNTYSTSLLGTNKITSATNQYFIFSFLDYNGYIKYDKDLFDSFNKKQLKITRSDIKDVPKQYFLIPVDKLTELKSNNIINNCVSY